MERVKTKTDFDTLTSEAIDNIREDREQTKELLKDLVKYIETLQRSNEQLVKIAGLKQKSEKDETGLSSEERNEIFNELNNLGE